MHAGGRFAVQAIAYKCLGAKYQFELRRQNCIIGQARRAPRLYTCHRLAAIGCHSRASTHLIFNVCSTYQLEKFNLFQCVTLFLARSYIVTVTCYSYTVTLLHSLSVSLSAHAVYRIFSSLIKYLIIYKVFYFSAIFLPAIRLLSTLNDHALPSQLRHRHSCKPCGQVSESFGGFLVVYEVGHAGFLSRFPSTRYILYIKL